MEGLPIYTGKTMQHHVLGIEIGREDLGVRL